MKVSRDSSKVILPGLRSELAAVFHGYPEVRDDELRLSQSSDSGSDNTHGR